MLISDKMLVFFKKRAGGKTIFQDSKSKSDLIRYNVSCLFYCEQVLLPNSSKLFIHSLKQIISLKNLFLQE